MSILLTSGLIIVLILIGIYAFINNRKNNELIDMMMKNINEEENVENHQNIDINNNKINQLYNTEIIDILKGTFGKNRFIFFVDHNDAENIKLPYELLSPRRSLENDNTLFTLNTAGYDQYFIRPDIRDDNLDSNISLGQDFVTYKTYHDYLNLSRQHHSLYLNPNLTFNYRFDTSQSINHIGQSYKSMIKFVKGNHLTSQEIIDYYINLIKSKQPSNEEIYKKLIKFEKAKNALNRINTLDSHEKVLNLVERSNEKHTNNNDNDNVDKELLSFVQFNNKL